MTLNKHLLAAAVASGLLLSATANAGTVAYTTSFGAVQTFVPTDWYQTLVLPEFNNVSGAYAGDILNSATLYYGGEVVSAFSATNNGNATTVSLHTVAELDFGTSASVSAGGATGVGQFGATLSPSNTVSNESLAAGATQKYGPFTSSAPSSTAGQNVALNTAAVTGTGSFSTSVDALGKSFVTSSGNFSSSVATTAEAEITVVYNYTARVTTATVPEPAGLALLAVGVAGLGFRRNKKA